MLSGFQKLWVAHVVSVSGDLLALFAVISLVTFGRHGSPVEVTYVTLAYMLPLAIAGPLAGVLVDHWDPKRVMVASDVVRAALASALAFVGPLGAICAVLACMSVVSSLFMPAQTRALRSLVGAEALLTANAKLAQAFYAARIVAPAAAGALVAWLSAQICFHLNALSFLCSAFVLAALPLRATREDDPARPRRAFLPDLAQGLRALFTHSGLAFGVLAMAVAMFVLSCFGPLVSVYVRDVVVAGTVLFGIVSASVGVGLFAGAYLVGLAVRRQAKEEVVVGGLVAIGAGVGLLGLVPGAATAIGGALVMGAGVSLVLVPAHTLMQEQTPVEMLGRVSGSFLAVLAFAQALGLLASGHLAALLGIRTLFALSALALVASALWGHRHVRRLQARTGARAAAQREARAGAAELQ